MFFPSSNNPHFPSVGLFDHYLQQLNSIRGLLSGFTVYMCHTGVPLVSCLQRVAAFFYNLDGQGEKEEPEKERESDYDG